MGQGILIVSQTEPPLTAPSRLGDCERAWDATATRFTRFALV
jgi:hypothetical protein